MSRPDHFPLYSFGRHVPIPSSVARSPVGSTPKLRAHLLAESVSFGAGSTCQLVCCEAPCVGTNDMMDRVHVGRSSGQGHVLTGIHPSGVWYSGKPRTTAHDRCFVREIMARRSVLQVVTLCLHFDATPIDFWESSSERTPCQAQKNAVSTIHRSGHRTGWSLTF